MGAILGASLHPLPEDRFQADAVVVVLPSDNRRSNSNLSTEATTRALASAAELPQVAARAALAAPALDLSEGRTRGRINAIGDLRSGLIRVRARGASAAIARALADAVAEQSVSFVRRATEPDLVEGSVGARFTFDRGAEGWTSGSLFSRPADDLSTVRVQAQDGAGALGFVCAAGGPGCGPGVRIVQTFVPGQPYVARAFGRTVGGASPTRLVVGADSGDVAAGPTVTLGSAYRELTVRWTPRAQTEGATLAVQTRTGDRAILRIDTVSLGGPLGASQDESAVLSTARLARLQSISRSGEPTRLASVTPAASVPNLESRTWLWSLFGALGGLVVSLAGLGTSSLARRRAE